MTKKDIEEIKEAAEMLRNHCKDGSDFWDVLTFIINKCEEGTVQGTNKV